MLWGGEYRGIAVDVISGAGHIPDVDFLEEGTGAYSHCGCFWRKGVQAHIPMFFGGGGLHGHVPTVDVIGGGGTGASLWMLFGG